MKSPKILNSWGLKNFFLSIRRKRIYVSNKFWSYSEKNEKISEKSSK